MCDAIKHRGPDDEGYFLDGQVGLGNRRLSIIDVKGGHQPIHNEDESIWITYNGEIYNFQELRGGLEPKHRFYTNSDTETIVHAYEEWGTGCLRRFNGMWAFALWDSSKKVLFLARDRFGVKPLYYHYDGKRLLFASEIKALLQDNSVARIPNDRVVYEYLLYGLHDHGEETFFQGVKRLLPGHYMLVDESGLKTQRWWELQMSRELDSPPGMDGEYAKRFYELFEDAVRLRLISEVPVGTCLSGGTDSSSIVCVVNRLLLEKGWARDVIGERQKTFSAVYDDERIDEREYIDEVVAHTEVERNFTFPTVEELWNELERLVYYQEEPFGSTSIFAQWMVMKLASQKVKVLLDGQGGDELLAGYIPYYGIFYLDLLKRRKYARLLKEAALSFDIALPFVSRYFSRSRRTMNAARMLDEAFAERFKDVKALKWHGNDLASALDADLSLYSIPHLLRYEDKNSMAFSIEARVPFLDYRLVEYVYSLPLDQRLRGGWTKRILREAMRGVLPERIRLRRSKVGFETPEAKWMKASAEKMRAIFTSETFAKRGYFNQAEVLKAFDKFLQGRLSEDFIKVFWRLANLELWLREFFDDQNGG
ncbi:MAG: asparagine synthase (glutamine-hydrolyzing), partial [Candidatus Bathyarchaeia archaeon]